MRLLVKGLTRGLCNGLVDACCSLQQSVGLLFYLVLIETTRKYTLTSNNPFKILLGQISARLCGNFYIFFTFILLQPHFVLSFYLKSGSKKLSALKKSSASLAKRNLPSNRVKLSKRLSDDLLIASVA